MFGHRVYEKLAACQSDLSVTEQRRLEHHLGTCQRCQQLADDYAGQTAFLRSYRRDRPSMEPRNRLLTDVDQAKLFLTVGAHPAWKATLLRTGAAALLLGAILVNIPLSGALAGVVKQTVPSVPALTFPGTQAKLNQCLKDGWAYVGPATRITSPGDFVATGGTLFPHALMQASALPGVQYWILPAGGIRSIKCASGVETEIGVRYNSSDDTYLYAVSIH